MPASDYASVGSGALKLKGAAGVEKKKKKKKKPTSTETLSATSQKEVPDGPTDATDREITDDAENEPSDANADTEKELARFKSSGGKTEAEVKFEEQRKRRLNERLKREGVKTHKERVEDLNRYLSTLSEHHDMPRIGPG